MASSVASVVASSAAGGACTAGVDCSTCPDCGSCFGCHIAPGGDCYQTYCAPNPECVALGNCVFACAGNQQCAAQCYASHPGGQTSGQLTVNCGCQSCPACAGQPGC